MLQKQRLYCLLYITLISVTALNAETTGRLRASFLQSGRANTASDSLPGLKTHGLLHKTHNSDISESEVSDIILDKAIDPQEYIVGPGDRFSVFLWGKVEDRFDISVNSEGMIILPSIGAIDVTGKSLAAARDLMTERLSSSYRGVTITVSLVRIRQFRCYVSGEVINPGAYIMTGVMRVSDAIAAAGGITDSGSVRVIIISNKRYGNKKADLSKFHNSGNIEANPYLRDGDRIFIMRRNEYVSVNGWVNYPGQYDFCEGDNLTDIIEAAGGIRRGADSNRVIVTRFSGNSEEISHTTAALTQAADFKIERDDRILVSGISGYRIHRAVIIEGEIQFPGSYPIIEGRTRLKDIINMAGGFTEMASQKSSRIVRDTVGFANKNEYESIRSFAEGGQDPMEAAYIKSRVRQDQGVVEIDFSALETDNNNILMRNGDRIIIARNETTVRVSGAVASPGHIVFENGDTYRTCIKKAGGFSGNAKKSWIKIRRYGSTAWQSPQSAGDICPGDEILVGERPYRESFSTIRDVIVMLSSAATIILMIVTISDQANGN